MAWNTRWQVQFTSIDGNAYMLNIQQDDYSGSVTQLTGADNPFITQEDDDDNAFTPIRTQTGYINLIDTQGGLLKELMPSYPLQNYVVLLCDGNIKWQGFISQQAYTQEWIETPADPQDRAVPTEVSIPVNGLLESLKYVSLPLTDFATEANLAKLIYKLFSLLNVFPASLVIGGADVYPGRWMSYILKWYVLFTPRTQTNDGVEYTDYESLNGYEIMEYICTLFACTAREDDNRLVFTGYYGNVRGVFAPFSKLNQFTSTTYPSSISSQTYDMMSAFTWKGDDNKVNYLEGLKSIQATLPLYTNALDVIEIPNTEENINPVLTVDAYYWSGPTAVTVYMQPHEPRGSVAMETYQFVLWRNEWTGTSPNKWPVMVGTSNYNTVKNSTVFESSLKYFSFNKTRGNEMATGAFPCRWSPDGQNYKSGIFFQFIETGPWSDGTQRDLIESYSIKSRISFTFASGYFRLDFKLSGFWIRGLNYLTNPEFYYYNEDYGGFRMLVYIRLGNNYWNGSAWTTTRTHCLLQITNGRPPQNWDASMGVKQEDGYYIPITSTMTGVMQLEVTSLVVLNSSDQEYGRRNMIMSDFVFEKAQANNPLVAGRTQNIYRLSIDDNQSEEKALNLKFGTWNSNSENPVFLKDENDNYVESIEYYVYGNQRPEMHLLYLIKEYYQSRRHSFEAVVDYTHRLPVHRITHNDRTYIAIAAERRWNDDQTRVKFIDVTLETSTSSNSSNSVSLDFEESEPDTIDGVDAVAEEEESTEEPTNEQEE